MLPAAGIFTNVWDFRSAGGRFLLPVFYLLEKLSLFFFNSGIFGFHSLATLSAPTIEENKKENKTKKEENRRKNDRK